MTHDIYVTKFSNMLDESLLFRTNPMIRLYVSSLLASYMKKTNLFAEPLALKFLSLETVKNAKDLGDLCLLASSLFSGLRKMDDQYYIEIGATSYYHAANTTNSEVFAELSHKFEPISTSIKTLKPPKYI